MSGSSNYPTDTISRQQAPDPRLRYLRALEKKALWLSTWMVHNANHIRANDDGLKVGGHQASSASLNTILTVLYGAVLQPEDRVAVKPHASPSYHALQYLLGRQTSDKLEHFRAWGGAQSYPSRTKDTDDVDFSTGSVGLGASQTLFAALAQDYIKAKDWGEGRPVGRMVALLGDAELDEGNVYEALVEGWKHEVRNVWWIIDYNRQSLDAIVREGLWSSLETVFRNFGWDVVILKYGSLQQAAFAEPGGDKLKAWIDTCPNQIYSALCFQGGAAWRKRLLDEIGDQGAVTSLIERRNDEDLADLMTDLGGHDPASLLEAFEKARLHDRPTCFICYTVKGMYLPLQGHKDNHSGLLTEAQIDELRAAHGIRHGHEWGPLEGTGIDPDEMRAFIETVPFTKNNTRRTMAKRIDVPARIECARQSLMSTQQGFGSIMTEIARSGTELANRIVTTSPDVTVSTNLGGWVNRRGLFSRRGIADEFKRERIPSTFVWDFSEKGQHMELGIAEMNLFAMLSAFGLSHVVNGERVVPIGTLYDPFIYRGADALNYACYQNARFILVATPSGISLAAEGGAHQSIGTPLLGLAQDGLVSFEPAFVDELAVVMHWAFDFIQRSPEDSRAEELGGPDASGGSVYLRLSTRPIEQPLRVIDEDIDAAIIAGAYWLRPPGPNCELVVAYQGVVAPEAIQAVGMMAEDYRDIALLAVTSSDRLLADWQHARALRRRGTRRPSHIERLLSGVSRNAGLVTVIDGHPLTLAWLGSVAGHRVSPLGVESFGQSGNIQDLYRHHEIDCDAIVAAAEEMCPARIGRS